MVVNWAKQFLGRYADFFQTKKRGVYGSPRSDFEK